MKWLIGILLIIVVAAGLAIGLPFNDSKTLCWDWPVANTDGSPLTDLAGAKIYWSQTSGAYLDIDSKDVGMATPSGAVSACYTVTTLQGTWNLVSTTYNTAKIESAFSNEIKRTFAKVPRSNTNLR